MHRDLLNILSCPVCHGTLTLVDASEVNGDVDGGSLVCATCDARYPIVRGIPRFVSPDNYSASFGLQWNAFRRTQLDSSTGQPITARRFFEQTGWPAEKLTGRLVLDVGCGAGRFAEVALSAGARLVAVDYSSAVEACKANLAGRSGVDVVQADVYHLPFTRRMFDFVYCFGVLQHTPDVHAACLALRDQLAPAGRLAVDVYPRIALNAVWPKYWLRPLTRRMAPERLFRFVETLVIWLWPVSRWLGRVPGVGRRLRHALPVANYEGILPLSPAQLKEWAVLDTFDMLAPAHDHPQSAETIRAWLEEMRLEEIQVFRRGLVVGRGRAPASADAG